MFQANYKDTRLILTETILVFFVVVSFPGVYWKQSLKRILRNNLQGNISRSSFKIKYGGPFLPTLNLKLRRNRIYTMTLHWNFNLIFSKRNRFLLFFLLCFSLVVLIYTNFINLILNCIMNYLVIRLMIFNRPIKKGNLKLW